MNIIWKLKMHVIYASVAKNSFDNLPVIPALNFPSFPYPPKSRLKLIFTVLRIREEYFWWMIIKILLFSFTYWEIPTTISYISLGNLFCCLEKYCPISVKVLSAITASVVTRCCSIYTALFGSYNNRFILHWVIIFYGPFHFIC